MARQITNRNTGKVAFDANSDANGAYIAFENGVRIYSLTTAVTKNVTTTTAPAGSIAFTSHATGRGRMFVSDAAKWQLAVATAEA